LLFIVPVPVGSGDYVGRSLLLAESLGMIVGTINTTGVAPTVSIESGAVVVIPGKILFRNRVYA